MGLEMTHKYDICERTKCKKKVRRLIADYITSEGCSCCSDVDSHKKHLKKLAKLLNVPQYHDGSGYDFGMFETKKKGSDKT